MTKITAHRYHDISCGHRVVGHEGKCQNLHGHNYRVHFYCEVDELDALGRVVDFGIIKSLLCNWLEVYWDHKMIINFSDPWLKELRALDPTVVSVPFNPTAENLGKYLVEVIGPRQLEGTAARLVRVVIEETRKCGATIDV